MEVVVVGTAVVIGFAELDINLVLGFVISILACSENILLSAVIGAAQALQSFNFHHALLVLGSLFLHNLQYY
jgi:hypothetical protein